MVLVHAAVRAVFRFWLDCRIAGLRVVAVGFFFAGSRFHIGLLALPLCGAAVTFFAAAKKVTKETAFPTLSTSRRPRHRRCFVVRQ
jgi:hypothetical protein